LEVDGRTVKVGSIVSKEFGCAFGVGRRLGRGRREGLIVGLDVGRVAVVGDDVAVKLGGSTIGTAVGKGIRILVGCAVGVAGC
jgi:hypothetical protein